MSARGRNKRGTLKSRKTKNKLLKKSFLIVTNGTETEDKEGKISKECNYSVA